MFLTERIQKFIVRHQLLQKGVPVLVACSGGIDSMTLCLILKNLNYTIGIAHCNFQLRGEESEGDEIFVQDFASINDIPFHSIKFDTKTYKRNNALSTQMAARELRYSWFEEIRKEHGYHRIITAHHLDDNIETMLLNMAKGSGIKGIRGMLPKSGYIVRPLLEISKEELTAFALENNILYREDASNAQDDYQRNAIRHHIVPELQKLNSNLYESLHAFMSRMRDYEVITAAYLESIKKKCCTVKNGISEIKTGFIKSHNAGSTVLFHLLAEYGFNTDQCALIFEHIINENQASGKQFFSEDYRLVKDRKSLFLVKRNIEREAYLLLDKIPNTITFNNYSIDCKIVPIAELNIKKSNRYAYFDVSKIEFPLLLRYPLSGDYFYPFGMSKPKSPEKAGKKKLSKYFKDEKFTLLEKENTPVFFSGEKMMWLVGHRIDDRFKITDKTKTVLKMVIRDECD